MLLKRTTVHWSIEPEAGLPELIHFAEEEVEVLSSLTQEDIDFALSFKWKEQKDHQ